MLAVSSRAVKNALPPWNCLEGIPVISLDERKVYWFLKKSFDHKASWQWIEKNCKWKHWLVGSGLDGHCSRGWLFQDPPISNSSGSNSVTIVHPASALSCENNQRLSSVQFSSVAQSCLTLCDPTNCSTPGLPVHHHLPEFTQTHVHRVSDAIQPSHPLSSPFPPAPNPSHHQSLFQWVNSSHEVAKVLEFQL